MCTHTIIDTSVFNRFGSAEMQPLLDWIERGHGILVYTNSGMYAKEIEKSPKIAGDRFMSYRQSGVARLVNWNRVQNQELKLASAALVSNDRHIIALARASNTLVLCACDGRLKDDFLNRELLPSVNRRGRAVYPLGSARKDQQDFLRRRECPRQRRASRRSRRRSS